MTGQEQERRDRLDDDLRQASPRLLAHLVWTVGQLDAASFDKDPAFAAFNEGRRDVARQIVNDLRRIDPALYRRVHDARFHQEPK